MNFEANWSWLRWVIAIGAIPVAVFLSYQLARIGEPKSLWLWRDILGYQI